MQRGEREDRVEGDDEQRGPEVAGRLLDRVFGAVDHHLFLDARVHLDRVVDADAEHHREPGDGHDGERDAEVAGEAERPDHADQHDEQRQEAPPHPEQERRRISTMISTAMAPSVSMPPRQVVVDVLEEDRRRRS